MALQQNETERGTGPSIPHLGPAEGTGVLEAANEPHLTPLQRVLKVIGPGVITGASDDDPSGIGTYAVAGATYGFGTLWTALFTFPLMASMQFICAKIGMVSGQGLAGVLRQHYPRWILYPAVFLLFVANTVNAGADIGAIAAAINLLVPPLPITLMVVPVAVLILLMQIFGSYRLIANVFRWLALALIAYIASAFFAHPNTADVLSGTLVPSITFDSKFISTLVAILGTTISPYLFFWQASQEVEEEIAIGRARLWQRKGATNSELKYKAWDVNLGMFFSNLVMYFIIMATGATLFVAHQYDIQSAADAAQALRPLAGDAAGILLAVGLIGAGFLAVPILTGSAAYGLSEAFGWKYGLDRKPGRAKQFYAVIVIATLVGVGINYVGINPIDALFWTAVVNGVLAPPLMVLIMLVANHPTVMGDRINGRWTNLMGWLATVAMFAAAIALFVTWGQ
ncbi:MAG: Nramp family divalent metal transporter [Chloroflexota bacterium]